MPQDFKDAQTAQEWDRDTVWYNPTRPEQLDLLLTLLADHLQPGATLIDLGFGSGQVEKLLFERIPTVKVIGVDHSPAMMSLARERLQPYQDRLQMIEHDLRDLPHLPVPAAQASAIISVQALHHLTDSEMQVAYRAIHDLLAPGGLFLLLDRIHVNQPALYPAYQSFWCWLDQKLDSKQATHEGADYNAHLKTLHDRDDIPLAPERHLELMRDAGMQAACLHLSGVRALFAATRS
jgi:SAM-dependent methyltransferase